MYVYTHIHTYVCQAEDILLSKLHKFTSSVRAACLQLAVLTNLNEQKNVQIP